MLSICCYHRLPQALEEGRDGQGLEGKVRKRTPRIIYEGRSSRPSPKDQTPQYDSSRLASHFYPVSSRPQSPLLPSVSTPRHAFKYCVFSPHLHSTRNFAQLCYLAFLFGLGRIAGIYAGHITRKGTKKGDWIFSSPVFYHFFIQRPIMHNLLFIKNNTIAQHFYHGKYLSLVSWQ